MAKIGIEQTTELTRVVLKLAKVLSKKSGIFAKIRLVFSLGGLTDLYKNRGVILAEIKDLDASEMFALVQYIQSELQLKSEHANAIVRQSLEVIKEVLTLVNIIKDEKI